MIKTAGDRVEWTFPADPSAVRTARLRVRSQLADWGLDALGDVAVLLVSELVTNSVRYAVGPIEVSLVRPGAAGEVSPDGPSFGGPSFDGASRDGASADALLVEVSDPLPDPPRTREATVCDESGRGLHLVAGVARRWGTRRHGTGKTVWFELPLPG